MQVKSLPYFVQFFFNVKRLIDKIAYLQTFPFKTFYLKHQLTNIYISIITQPIYE